jgi:uncharacterized protein (DUF1684 family)
MTPRADMFVIEADKPINLKEVIESGYSRIPVIEEDFDHIIDFNNAYNPYCAYNKEFTCPLVPEENHLDIKIYAGEKSFLSADDSGHQ